MPDPTSEKMNERVMKLETLNHRWNRAMSQFAAGSEFYNDPERTADAIRQLRDTQMRALRRITADRDRLQKEFELIRERPSSVSDTIRDFHAGIIPDWRIAERALQDAALTGSGGPPEHPDTGRLKKLRNAVSRAYKRIQGGDRRLGLQMEEDGSITIFDAFADRRIAIGHDLTEAIDALPEETDHA